MTDVQAPAAAEPAGGTPNTTRAPLLDQRFNELGVLLAETLQPHPEDPRE